MILNKSYLQLHIAIFLWGFTAILGDIISLSAFWLVWWRVGITSASLLMLSGIRANLKTISLRLVKVYLLVGVLIAIHWVTFFGSIKYANASVALVAMSTASFFTAFLEPIYFKSSIRRLDVFFGFAIVPGMILVVNGLSGNMLLGFGVGLISAFLAALFAVINKKYVNETEPKTITFIELFGSFVFLTLLIPFVNTYQSLNWLPTGLDWMYLMILSILCTSVAFILHLYALKHISAFASNLAINLEPVYGIILAGLLLGDVQELSVYFYLGVLMILLCVTVYPIISRRVA